MNARPSAAGVGAAWQKKEVVLRFVAATLPEGASANRIQHWVERMREKGAQTFSHWDGLGILRKLFFDEDQPQSLLPLLRTLGFVHLFTASGIHLYSVARISHDLWFFVARSTGLGIARALWFARGFAFISWLCVWILGGLRPGMLRPWIVVVARALAQGLGFRWNFFAPLVVAISADLLVALLRFMYGYGQWAPGGLHYALAVGGGLLALEFGRSRKFDGFDGQGSHNGYINHKGARGALFQDHVYLAVGSWVFTALLDCYEAGLVALATPALSLITLPLFCGLLFPLGLLVVACELIGLPSVSSPLAAWVGSLSTELVSLLLRVVSGLPTLWVVSGSGLLIGIFCASFVFIFNKTVRIKTGLVVAALLLLIRVGLAANLSVNHTPGFGSVIDKPGADEVEQLDVGQGDAALVIYGSDRYGPGKAGLVDVGSEKALGVDAWLRLFAGRGITRISWIALTHLDEDHAGGLMRLAKVIPIDCVILGQDEFRTARGLDLVKKVNGMGIRVDAAGSREKVEKVHDKCFPFQAVSLREAKRKRGLSVAAEHNGLMSSFLIPLKNGLHYLSMGDAGGEMELRAAKWARGLLKTRESTGLILKVSHHGSRFSTSDEVLELLRPDRVWVSSGIGNHFGHPTTVVLKRLKKAEAAIERTDFVGVLSGTRAKNKSQD